MSDDPDYQSYNDDTNREEQDKGGAFNNDFNDDTVDIGFGRRQMFTGDGNDDDSNNEDDDGNNDFNGNDGNNDGNGNTFNFNGMSLCHYLCIERQTVL